MVSVQILIKKKIKIFIKKNVFSYGYVMDKIKSPQIIFL